MSDYRDWQVGDRVVCVDDQWHDDNGIKYECPLHSGTVYTISGIGESNGLYRGAARLVVVDLVEVKNPDSGFFPRHVPGFAAARFRKVQPRKTSIAILERFLKDADAPIHEEA